MEDKNLVVVNLRLRHRLPQAKAPLINISSEADDALPPSVLWESFRHPTATTLSVMNLPGGGTKNEPLFPLAVQDHPCLSFDFQHQRQLTKNITR